MEFLASKTSEITSEEIIDFLLINEQIDAGIKAIEKCEFKTLEQAREYYQKWLT